MHKNNTKYDLILLIIIILSALLYLLNSLNVISVNILKQSSRIYDCLFFLILSLLIIISYFFESKSNIFKFIMYIFGGIRGWSSNRKCAIFWSLVFFIGSIIYLIH
jgi:hypothetical protein